MSMSNVILVDEKDQPTGICSKEKVHAEGQLHRAFSIFIFNADGQMLLQRRSAGKYHSAELWTNACCSHPRPDESVNDAANRRLYEEMGFNTSIEKAFEFIYRAELNNGLIEHEYDHVFVGEYEGEIHFNPQEVMETKFIDMLSVKTAVEKSPEQFTAWFAIALPLIEDWWRSRYNHLPVK